MMDHDEITAAIAGCLGEGSTRTGAVIAALEQAGYAIVRRDGLVEIADRLARSTESTVGYSLQETPRVLKNMPTLIEICMGHFKEIEGDLRQLVQPAAGGGDA
jgi:hypothetical protein